MDAWYQQIYINQNKDCFFCLLRPKFSDFHFIFDMFRVTWNVYMPRFELSDGKADVRTSEGYYLQTFIGLV